ncbi:MAG: hypothetical protein JST59_29705 [Actinobacteria bacterium]|nr:hypothetical protein [Actinomycetota bacterium]
MRMVGRILRAVTMRRVLAALLIGAFAKEIVAVLSWLADTGWELKDVAAARGLAVAGLRLVFEGALICLALRGLAAVLDRGGRRNLGGREKDVGEAHDVIATPEGAGPAADLRPGKGGRDGHGPDEDR